MAGTGRTAAGSEVSRFPDLFAPGRLGPVSWTFRLIEAEPCDADVANVTVVPYTAAGWVVLVLADGRPEVPGGTREPGEAIEATLRRELMEEAGARLETFKSVWRVGLRFNSRGSVPAASAASGVPTSCRRGAGGTGGQADDWGRGGCS